MLDIYKDIRFCGDNRCDNIFFIFRTDGEGVSVCGKAVALASGQNLSVTTKKLIKDSSDLFFISLSNWTAQPERTFKRMD